MSVSMSHLATQLSQLGRDLDDQVTVFAQMEKASTEAEGRFRVFEALYDDAIARATLISKQSSAESRKAEARLACISERQEMEVAALEWNRQKSLIRVQQASISALHRRCDIGRSLLSREKLIAGLEISGSI